MLSLLYLGEGALGPTQTNPGHMSGTEGWAGVRAVPCARTCCCCHHPRLWRHSHMECSPYSPVRMQHTEVQTWTMFHSHTNSVANLL